MRLSGSCITVLPNDPLRVDRPFDYRVGRRHLAAAVFRANRAVREPAPVLTPFMKTSNNQIPAVDVLLAWWYGLGLGAAQSDWDRTEADEGGSPQAGDLDRTLLAIGPSPHATGSSP